MLSDDALEPTLNCLLDIVDYYEPVMLIVGSRGLGNLKG